jgi:hypothetical protein
MRAEAGFSRHLNFRLFQQYLRIAVVHCLVFARQRSPNQPDEAWCLASEGGRELKVGRELRCHAPGAHGRRSPTPTALQ